MSTNLAIDKQISDFYFSMFQTNMDTRIKSFAVASIVNKTMTLNEYFKMMLKSEQYISFLRKKFIDHYCNLVCYNKTDAINEFNKFLNKDITKPIKEEEIVLYIKNTKAFEDKYRTLILSTYELHNVKLDNRVDAFIDKFKSLDSYDINMLKDDIINQVQIKLNNDDKIIVKSIDTEDNEMNSNYDCQQQQCNEIGKTVIELLGYVPTLEKLKDIFSDKNKIEEEVDEDYDLTNESLDEFEKIFKRPMFVQESFKYTNDEQWDEIYTNYISKYNKFVEIHRTYLTSSIPSEYYFVKNYLFEFNHENFFETLIDKIVNSSTYECNMSKIIQNTYKSMYDNEINDKDVSYIFNIIKSQKLSLQDENITKIVQQVKNETDTISYNIYKTYVKVLERQPDTNELQQHIINYRQKDMEEMNQVLEKTLMKSLEFHDVIKKKIKDHYESIQNKSIIPSKLFDILAIILNKLDTIMMDEIDDTIIYAINTRIET